MKNNHHPTQYTMKDLFAALDPMSSLVSLHQSKKNEEEEEFKVNKDTAAKDDSKSSAAMGGMNSSSTASLHLPTHHYTMEDLFEALDPMSFTNRSRIQSCFTLQPGHRYKAYAQLRRESEPQMKLQPQQQLQRQVQHIEAAATTTTGLNTVTNFTQEQGPRYKAYAELRRELKLHMREKWCHHMRESLSL